MLTSNEIATLMAAHDHSPEAQKKQTHFRHQLVKSWHIHAGDKVLEIGCGQGDMTAVLANAVGKRGSVVAVDSASSTHGTPATLAESAAKLAASSLGDRIEFRFQHDVLHPSNGFADDTFDVVVLSHCTWYFDSLDQLRETLRHIHPWARRLCLSEWDMEPAKLDQVGHLMAVLIQGQVEAFKKESRANIRTPYSRETLKSILWDTSWNVAHESLVDGSDLDDGRWEVAACLSDSLREAEALHLSPKVQELLRSQVDILRRLEKRGGNRSLPSYSMVAERASGGHDGGA